MTTVAAQRLPASFILSVSEGSGDNGCGATRRLLSLTDPLVAYGSLGMSVVRADPGLRMTSRDSRRPALGCGNECEEIRVSSNGLKLTWRVTLSASEESIKRLRREASRPYPIDSSSPSSSE